MENYSEYLWNMVFANPDPIGRWVNLLIFGLFAVAVADVIASLGRLARERGIISRVREEMKASPIRETADGKMLEQFNIDRESLLGRRISRILRLREAGLGHREVLQQITAERIEGYGALARYIGATLTLLGLLGTVFGLSFALVKIQGALSGVQDLEGLSKLTEALGGTLYGMKTAFGCTLAGIFTAVITSYLNHQVRRTQSRVAAGLEDFVIFDLLPALEAFDPNADNTAKAFANAMSSSAKKLNQVQNTISEAAGKYEEGSQELHRAVEALGSVVQSFSNSISVVASNQQAFTQTMSDTRNALNSMASMLTKQFEDLRAHTALSNKVLEERLNIMEQASKTNTSLQESLHTLAQSFQPAILEYHKQFREFLGASQEEFRNSLKGLLTEINQHYRDGVSAHVSNSQKAFDDALKAHAEEMKQLIEKQGAALSAFCDMVLDANIRMGTLYNRITGDDNHREKIATQGGLQ